MWTKWSTSASARNASVPTGTRTAKIAVMVDAYDLLIAYDGALERLRDAVQEMREDGDLDLRTVLEYIDAIRKDIENGDG